MNAKGAAFLCFTWRKESCDQRLKVWPNWEALCIHISAISLLSSTEVWQKQSIAPRTSSFCWKCDSQQVWQPEILSREANCKELGCVFVPLVVEAYGAWGMTKAMESLSHLASRLATSSNKAKARAVVLTDLYGRLNLNLVRANATAILTRCVAYIYLLLEK
ncbi:hypothetical protein EMCRGX_G017405 [Ephydatia muelleri]